MPSSFVRLKSGFRGGRRDFWPSRQLIHTGELGVVAVVQAESDLELPSIVVADRGDGPGELFAESLREESLNGHIELVGEDDAEPWVDVILP